MTKFLLALIAVLATVGPAFAQTGRILVMPFENTTRESRIFWLSEASAVLLADDLNLLGADAITREERRQAFDRLQVPPAASLTHATVIRLGQLVGAGQVVVGTLQLHDEALVVQARSIALETGRITSSITERAPLGDLFDIFERVARRLGAPSSRSTEEVRRENPPVAAFENYIKGLLAETPETAIAYLNAALKIQSTFDRARLTLWRVYEDQGDYDLALRAARGVTSDSRSIPRARFLSGLSLLELKGYDEAFATFEKLADERPTAAVWNNIGVVQLRRGATPQTGLPAYYFNKAAEADATDPDYFFNLGYAYWMARDTQAAIFWLREAVRRNAADGDAHFILGAALASAGNAAEANREKELARRLSSVYLDWEKRPGSDPVPNGLERVKGDVELPHPHGLEEALTGQRDQQELAGFYLDRGRRLYEQEKDREALAELNRALFLSPYRSDAHMLVGRIHLRAGRTRDAIDAFKISLWSEETPEAHAALAEAYVESKDPMTAAAEAQRALALDPASAAARRVLDQVSGR